MMNKYVLALKKVFDNLNQKLSLKEMSTLCKKDSSFSFIIRLNSNDHTPPHLHFFKKDGKTLLVKIKINEICPSSIEDIKGFEWKVLETNKFKKEVLHWFLTKNKYGILNWKVAHDLWEDLHTD